MNDEVLKNIDSGAHPGGGSTDKLANREIATKYAKLAAAHQREPDERESVESLRRRNNVLRAVKHLPPRGEASEGAHLPVEEEGERAPDEFLVIENVTEAETQAEPVLIPTACTCVVCKPRYPMPLFLLSTRKPIKVCQYCLTGTHAI